MNPLAIKAFLSTVPWRAIAAGALVLAVAILWFRGSYYRDDAKAEKALADTAIEINAGNAVVSAERDKQLKTADAVNAALDTALRKARGQLTKLEKDLDNASSKDDGPVAAVLRHVIDGLPAPGSPGEVPADAAPLHSHDHANLRRSAGTPGTERHAEGRRS